MRVYKTEAIKIRASEISSAACSWGETPKQFMRAIAGKLNSGADKRNTTNNEMNEQQKGQPNRLLFFLEVSICVCGLYRNQMLVRRANGPVITVAADESRPGGEFRRPNQIRDFRNRLFGFFQ